MAAGIATPLESAIAELDNDYNRRRAALAAQLNANQQAINMAAELDATRIERETAAAALATAQAAYQADVAEYTAAAAALHQQIADDKAAIAQAYSALVAACGRQGSWFEQARSLAAAAAQTVNRHPQAFTTADGQRATLGSILNELPSASDLNLGMGELPSKLRQDLTRVWPADTVARAYSDAARAGGR